MASDNPVRRWFVYGTTTLLLVPVLWWCVASDYAGLVGCIRDPERLTPWVIAVAVGYLVAVLLLLRWGALRSALGLFLVAGYLHAAAVNNDSEEHGDALIVIGGQSQIIGVDVYCNEQYLGKTPLEITESEFLARVPRWPVPPRQTHVKPFLPQTPGKTELNHAGYTLVPADPFGDHHRPIGAPDLTWGGWRDTWPRLPAVGYWWRFEKQGCQGLTTIENFGGGSGGNRIYVTPRITFPSSHRQWQLLLEDLREHDFVASEEWLAYVLQWSDLLWPEMQTSAVEDERLAPVLRELVRLKWNLTAAATAGECRQLLELILQRISVSGALRYPSFESAGLLEIARLHPELIVEAYRPEPLHYRTTGWHSGGGSGWNYLAGDAAAVRRYALEYVISITTPRDLLDRLRIQQALLQDQYYSRILANFRRAGFAQAAPAIPLMNPPAGQVVMSDAVDLFTTTDNPALDDAAYAELLTVGKEHFAAGQVERLVRSRRGISPERLDKLADWISQKCPLHDNERALLLAHVHSPHTRAAFASIAPRVTSDGRLEVASLLLKRPNPYADAFLIETWEMLRRGQSHTVHSSVALAILACDTPHLRDWVLQKIAADDREWSDIAGCAKAPLPALRWLFPTASKLTDESRRVAILRPLAAMDTPEAWSLIETWSHDESEWLTTQARERLAERAKSEAEREEHRQQLADLLAGRIQPDELLPPPTAYVWTDRGYVPEGDIEP
jgi:hypothetical protein